MSRSLSFGDVKAAAVARVEDILDRLAPGGRAAGGTYTVRNPTRADRRAGSFVVYLRGPARGAFVEFAARDTECGDVVDLVSYLLSGGSLSFKDKAARVEAVRWIERALGLSRLNDSERSAVIDAARHRQRDAAAEEEAAAAKQRRAVQMFEAAGPLRDSLAEIYLAARGIDLSVIDTLTGDLRCLPAAEYWPGATRDGAGRKSKSGPLMPAMIAAFRDAASAVVGVHLTFLAADGGGKAKVPQAKLIWPRFQGATIRLTNGAGNRAADDPAAEPGLVVLTEGIEDGLTAAGGFRESEGERVWACGALGNIGGAPALPCVDAWLVHRQNDWQSRQAVESFDRQLARLAATGRPVATFGVPAGVKDINDLVRA